MTEKHESFSELANNDTLEYDTQAPSPIENTCEQDFPITLSRSLAKQLHNLAKHEGIHAFDLILELVTEGIARRIAEDQTRQAPSHLLTRNGYVGGDHQQHTQPSMSHHEFQNNGQGNARNKGNFSRHNVSTGLRPNNNNNRYNNRTQSNNNGYSNMNNNGNSASYFNKPTKK